MTTPVQNTLAIVCGGGPAPGINSVITPGPSRRRSSGGRLRKIYDGFLKPGEGEKKDHSPHHRHGKAPLYPLERRAVILEKPPGSTPTKATEAWPLGGGHAHRTGGHPPGAHRAATTPPLRRVPHRRATRRTKPGVHHQFRPTCPKPTTTTSRSRRPSHNRPSRGPPAPQGAQLVFET